MGAFPVPWTWIRFFTGYLQKIILSASFRNQGLSARGFAVAIAGAKPENPLRAWRPTENPKPET
jgi:hypothetical protein